MHVCIDVFKNSEVIVTSLFHNKKCKYDILTPIVKNNSFNSIFHRFLKQYNFKILFPI